jgi:hypothetical protein
MNEDIKKQKSKLLIKKFWYVFTLTVLLVCFISDIYLIYYYRSDITFDKLKKEFNYIISNNLIMFILLVIIIIYILLYIIYIIRINNEIDNLPK